MTIEDIMQSCNIPSQEQDAILKCLSVMRASWTTGVAEALAGAACTTVSYALNCFPGPSGCSTPNDFDPNTAFYCRPVIIYAGVRFV